MAFLHHSIVRLLKGRAIVLPQVLTLAALDNCIGGDVKFDLLLLDLIFGDELAVSRIAACLRRRPDTGIIVLTGDERVSRCRQCLWEGARGFVAKTSALQDLPPAVSAVWAGELFVSESIAPPAVVMTEGLEGLSAESLRVLRRLRRGRRHAEIAAELNIARKTVEYHVARIKKALRLLPGRTDWKSL